MHPLLRKNDENIQWLEVLQTRLVDEIAISATEMAQRRTLNDGG
jgi:hypothetical protein